MPNLVTGYPRDHGDIIKDIKELQDHAVSLIDELKYLFNNLDAGNVLEAASVSADNIPDLEDFLAEHITAGTIVTDDMLADSLYADMGTIADLTVDRISTSQAVYLWLSDAAAAVSSIQAEGGLYDKLTLSGKIRADGAALYFEPGGGIVPSDDVYFEGYERNINFCQGVPVEVLNEGLPTGVYEIEPLVDRFGNSIYWRKEIVSVAGAVPYDENGDRVLTTRTEATPYPVYVYKYRKNVKLAIEYYDRNGVPTPRISLGIGTGAAGTVNGRAFIEKTDTGVEVMYYSENEGYRFALGVTNDGAYQVRTNAEESEVDGQTMTTLTEVTDKIPVVRYYATEAAAIADSTLLDGDIAVFPV